MKIGVTVEIKVQVGDMRIIVLHAITDFYFHIIMVEPIQMHEKHMVLVDSGAAKVDIDGNMVFDMRFGGTLSDVLQDIHTTPPIKFLIKKSNDPIRNGEDVVI